MTYRPRLIRIAAGLIFAIAVLTIIQWAIGTRGWDLSAGLLTIVMVILGFWLVSVLLVRHEITKEFERSYPDQFEEKYGYLRTEVMKAIYSFLECGIPENGMVRVTYHRLLGFHPLCGILLPRYRVFQLKNPQKSCKRSVPKNRVFTPVPGGKTDKTVQNWKTSPIPTTDNPSTLPKTLKNLLDALDSGEYNEAQFFDFPIL